MKVKEFSSDSKNVVISLTTKCSAAERQYSVPLECLYDFEVDLQILNVFAGRATTAADNQTARTKAVIQSDYAASTLPARAVQDYR